MNSFNSAQLYACQHPSIVTNGLVTLFDFGDRNSYLGMGTVFKDLTGRAPNLALTNAPVWTGSNEGYETFNGTNQYATTATNYLGTFFRTGSFTIDAWINFSSVTNAQVGWFQTGNNLTSANGQWWFGRAVSGSSGLYCLRLNRHGATDETLSVPWTPTVNTWYNVVATRSGSVSSLYINGALTKSVSNDTRDFTGSNGNAGICIGVIGTPSYFPGRIGQCKAYNRCLSTQELINNYNAVKWRYFI